MKCWITAIPMSRGSGEVQACTHFRFYRVTGGRCSTVDTQHTRILHTIGDKGYMIHSCVCHCACVCKNEKTFY